MKSPKKRTLARKPRQKPNMLTDEQKKILEEAQFESLETDVYSMAMSSSDIVLDISNQGAAGSTYQISDTLATSISDLNLSGISTITLPNTVYSGSGATVGGIYSGSTSTYTINTSGTSSYNYNWNPTPATVEINGDGVNIKDNGDIKLGDVSLKDFMKTMQERLAILVPDPKKLEKFEALKKAYEHYKLMEKLCQEEPKEED